jgi:hypothetical protein
MRAAAAVSAALLMSVAPAAAQTPPTSQQPVQPPALVEEPLEPDRPDVTNGTHIVDIGLLQLEFGGIYSVENPGLRAFGSPFTARVGVFEWLELRFGTDGFLLQSDPSSEVTGIGNVQLGAKLRLWADPGGIPVLSILPTVNFATASADKGLGSGVNDYTVALLTGTDFLTVGHVDVNYGIGTIGAGGGAPRFTQHLVSVSASVAMTDRWNPYLEAFWYSRQNASAGAMTAIDGGAIYTVNPRCAIDGGVQVGVSQAAPDFSVFGGVSIVIGNILGDHGVHERQRVAEKRARAGARK